MATLVPLFSEPRQLTLSFALMLLDGFTGGSQLMGLYPGRDQEQEDQAGAATPEGLARLARRTTVRIAGRTVVPRRREGDATFLFFGLTPGAYTFEVRSPYYEPRDIPLALPRPEPRWPAFPDITLANETIPLNSPLQPAVYRAQRALVTLQPVAGYPFPAGATLVRGSVRAGSQPLAGAEVRRQGFPTASTTTAAGEYVLFFHDVPGNGQTITLEASHPLHAAVAAPVGIVRGLTVVKDFAL
jgi:hypothetical protein